MMLCLEFDSLYVVLLCAIGLSFAATIYVAYRSLKAYRKAKNDVAVRVMFMRFMQGHRRAIRKCFGALMLTLLLLVVGCSDPHASCLPACKERLGAELTYSGFSEPEALELQQAVDDWRGASPLVSVTLREGPDPQVFKEQRPPGHEANTFIAHGWIAIDPEATELRLIFAHELGHLFGLQHSDDPNDIMWKDVQPARSISAHDVMELELLYP